MSAPLARSALLIALLVGCSDNGPQVPILFVSPPAGSNGAGRVTSSPTGIDCSISNATSTGTCSANFDQGTVVTLSANSASGSGFTGWGGACSGSVITCTVTLDQNEDVTAQFSLANPRTLTVTGSAGSGSGTVTSSPGGLSCDFNGSTTSGTCSADFADGAVVTLTATSVIGSGFLSWGADCASAGSTPTCQVTMSQARSASAGFVSVSFSGLIADIGSTQSGLLVVNIPTAAADIPAAGASGVSFALAGNDVLATGTVRFFGGEPTLVGGTYDTVTKRLSVASGSGFSMSGEFSNDAFDGLFSDIATGTGGPATLLSASATTPPRLFCGRFTIGSTDEGAWNVVVSDTLMSGLKNSDTTFTVNLLGTLKGRVVALQLYDGLPSQQGSSVIGSASGSLSTDGVTMNGSYQDDEGGNPRSGSWQATTTACQ